MKKTIKSKSSSPSLFIGLCCYGGVHPQFMLSLIRLLKLAGGHLHLVSGDSLVSRARNKIAGAFLKSGHEYLLQIDTDIAFDPEKMWGMANRRLDVVGGAYALKCKERKWCLNALKEKKFQPDKTGLAEVKYVGTGMLCVRRNVFERLIELKMADEYCTDDNEKDACLHDFFKVGVEMDLNERRRRYLSEDWYFCEMARRAGFQIFADTSNTGAHYGQIIFPLDSKANG